MPAKKSSSNAVGESNDDLRDPKSDAYRAEFLASLKTSWVQKKLQPKELRAYQQEAVDAVFDKLSPVQPVLLHLATGGGKTRTANEVVHRFLDDYVLNPSENPVLSFAKDWALLKQAVLDFKSRAQRFVNRYGGDWKDLHPLNSFDPANRGRSRNAPNVVYMTLQTLLQDPGAYLDEIRPPLLVWDECHWGEKGKAAKIFTACKKREIAMLGLTATPRTESRWERVYSKSFSD